MLRNSIWSKVISGVIIITIIACQETDSLVNEQTEESLDKIFTTDKYPSINIETTYILQLKQGYISKTADTIRIKQGNNVIAAVLLSEPVVVAQAEKEEKWGFFQFPIVFRDKERNLIVKWQMRSDSQEGYGKDSYGRKISYDEGKTWHSIISTNFDQVRHRVELRNGDIIQVKDIAAKPVNSYTSFPNPVNPSSIANTFFYLEEEVPNDLQGVYLQKWHKSNNQTENIHSTLEDNGLLRYSVDGSMPIVWWGDIKELPNGFLLAGMYGGHYQNSKGITLRTSVTFYQSQDGGYSWRAISRIPYLPIDGQNYEDYEFDGDDGFTEPTFEILKENTYMCVMRTSSRTPMYKTFSFDGGKNWSRPEPFTQNGVMPNLLKLENGMIALTSGRPGIQLRICVNGDGLTWTEPIEFIQFMGEDGIHDIWEDTCGYTNLLEKDSSSFYVVYSDFTRLDENGKQRKSIIFREVKVLLKK